MPTIGGRGRRSRAPGFPWHRRDPSRPPRRARARAPRPASACAASGRRGLRRPLPRRIVGIELLGARGEGVERELAVVDPGPRLLLLPRASLSLAVEEPLLAAVDRLVDLPDEDRVLLDGRDLEGDFGAGGALLGLPAGGFVGMGPTPPRAARRATRMQPIAARALRRSMRPVGAGGIISRGGLRRLAGAHDRRRPGRAGGAEDGSAFGHRLETHDSERVGGGPSVEAGRGRHVDIAVRDRFTTLGFHDGHERAGRLEVDRRLGALTRGHVG